MSHSKPKTGALAIIEKKGGRFIVIVDDAELYDTRECAAKDIVQTWIDIQFGDGARVKDIDPGEHAAFLALADDPDSWRGLGDALDIFEWNVGGESSGTVTFYRKVNNRFLAN